MSDQLRCFLPICLFSIVISSAAIDGSATITSQGIQRSILYHAPGGSVADDLPVLLVFHGTGGNAQTIKSYSGFDAVADANGFLVVYPNSTNIGGVPQWNVYADEVAGHGGLSEPGATDDVIFVDDLLEYLCNTFNIDASRVYASGHSNGGFMAYLLAVQRPEKIAAIGPVAANLWGDDTYLTNYFLNDYMPVGVMHLHGDADNVVPYPDPTYNPNAYIWPLSAFASGNCGNTGYQSSAIATGVERLTFCDGTGMEPQRIELIRFTGMSHSWPEVTGFDTATEIWDFLSAHSVIPIYTCDLNSVPEVAAIEIFEVYPNPSNGIVHFDPLMNRGSRIELIDAQGRVCLEKQAIGGSVDLSGLPAGAYALKLIDPDGPVKVGKVLLR